MGIEEEFRTPIRWIRFLVLGITVSVFMVVLFFLLDTNVKPSSPTSAVTSDDLGVCGGSIESVSNVLSRYVGGGRWYDVSLNVGLVACCEALAAYEVDGAGEALEVTEADFEAISSPNWHFIAAFSDLRKVISLVSLDTASQSEWTISIVATPLSRIVSSCTRWISSLYSSGRINSLSGEILILYVRMDDFTGVSSSRSLRMNTMQDSHL